MTLEDILIPQLKKHEGFSAKLYIDTVGKQTIGYGRNLTDGGISRDEAEYMLRNDVRKAVSDTKVLFPLLDDFSMSRRVVLVNMMYNIGLPRMSQFHKMREALKNKDFDEAANQMLDSRWARQVGPRAIELSELMRKG